MGRFEYKHEPYSHTEWSADRLSRRMSDLMLTKVVKHNTEREQAIVHEIECLDFELKVRRYGAKAVDILGWDKQLTDLEKTQPIPVVDSDGEIQK